MRTENSSRLASKLGYCSAGESRNQAGAGTFLSAARRTVAETRKIPRTVECLGVAADKNVRAPARVAPAFVILLFAWPALAADSKLTLWYTQPAEKWTEALPIGNGRLGGMVFGGITNEHLQFNESTLWTGQPHEYQHEGAAKLLPQIRKLLFEGKQQQAEDLAMKEFM